MISNTLPNIKKKDVTELTYCEVRGFHGGEDSRSSQIYLRAQLFGMYLRKEGGKVWTRFIWLRIRSSCRLL
jgi:hypothetical protein